jgi:hypothetical protein
VERIVVDIGGDAVIGNAVRSDVTLPTALSVTARLVPHTVKNVTGLANLGSIRWRVVPIKSSGFLKTEGHRVLVA